LIIQPLFGVHNRVAVIVADGQGVLGEPQIAVRN